VVDRADPQMDERVRIARQREGLNQLGKVVDGAIDVVDLRPGSEAQLRERLEAGAEERVVEDRGVAADGAGALEAIDTSLGGGRREVDEPADLAGAPARLLDAPGRSAA
jgi:hypothetical protein